MASVVEEQVESSFKTQLLPQPMQLRFVLGEAIQKQITHDHRISEVETLQVETKICRGEQKRGR
jgi:hypothetical protein